MCLSVRPVMFIFERMDRVVPEGIVIVEHDESEAEFRNAGASSDPLAESVHVPDALRPGAGDANTAYTVAARAHTRTSESPMVNSEMKCIGGRGCEFIYAGGPSVRRGGGPSTHGV